MWWGVWYMHHPCARVFPGTCPDSYAFVDQYTLAARTPLFNLVGGFALSLTGDAFWSFQLTCVWLSWCFVAPLALVLRGLYGEGAARLALLLAPLNVWLLHLAWF